MNFYRKQICRKCGFEYKIFDPYRSETDKPSARLLCDDCFNLNKKKNNDFYQLFLNGRIYAKGSFEYIQQLIKDYVVSNNMYGKKEVNFSIVKRDSNN